MIAFCCWSKPKYMRLLNVLKKSLWQHEDVTFITEQMGHCPRVGPDEDTGLFLRKVEACVWWAQQTEEPTVFLDADTYIRGPLDEAWSAVKDIGVTVRDAERRINGGVIFMRPTNGAREFMDTWLRNLYGLIAGPDRGEAARKRHGSVDQAALRMAADAATCDVTELACGEWNACQEHWLEAVGTTNIVHVKGKLRQQCLGEKETTGQFWRYVEEWQAYESS